MRTADDERPDYLTEKRAEVVPEIDAWAPFDVADAAARLWEAVKADAEAGDPDAETALDALGCIGAQKRISDDKRAAARSVLVIRRQDGKTQRRANQAFRGTRRVAADGESFFQQSIWWEMGYDEVMALLSSIERAFTGAAEKLAAFRRVSDAYAAHRDAPSAAEACRLAGFDPREIEITDLDVRRMRAA